jgi:LacI family transcriptional regulator
MGRPTIRDLAVAAGVSISTANRVISGGAGVRQATMRRVRDAAETIGFYGLGLIDSRLAAASPKFRFGFLLQQPNRLFYKNMGQALQAAAAAFENAHVETCVEFLQELSPQKVAARMAALGETCDAVGVVAAVHPLVTQAVEALQRDGKPVFALISQLAPTDHAHYVGLDYWKAGRTAAWAFEHICRAPGKLGILVGNHRYRCQEMNEVGFRSYFREHAPEFTLLEPIITFESSAVAEELVERLSREHPDLAGLFITGGGMSGALAALRSTKRAADFVAIGYELMDNTRQALVDGTLTLVISHPLPLLAERTIAGMVHALTAKPPSAGVSHVLPFELYTRESI